VGELGWFDFLSIGKEFDVPQVELLGAALVFPMVGVFANLQQEKECDQHEFSNGLELPVRGRACCAVDVVGDLDWYGQLFLHDWVGLAVCFCLEGKCCMVGGGSKVVEWVFVANQFNGLSNGSKCGLDATGLDLLATSKFALPDPSSKNVQDQQSFCWSQVLKVWINVGGKEFGPMPPVMLPCSES